MNFTTFGLVIREKQTGENDKLLTVLTAEKGKITVLAKGVRKQTSKNSSACGLFCYSEFDLNEYNGLYSVRRALTVNSFYGLRCDMNRYALACYLAELVSFVTTVDNDETESLRLILNCFYALSEKKEAPFTLIKAVFELKLLCVMGYTPNMYDCILCCNETYENSHKYCFSFSDGSIVCDKCKASINQSGCIFISSDVVNAARYVINADMQKLLSFSLSEEKIVEFSEFCERFLLYNTENTFETLRIYKSIIKTENPIKSEKK